MRRCMPAVGLVVVSAGLIVGVSPIRGQLAPDAGVQAVPALVPALVPAIDATPCRLWAAPDSRSPAAASRLSWGRPAVDHQAVYGLSRDHELLAFARGSRALLWRQRLGGGSGGTEGEDVYVVGDMVVVGDGGVFAVAAATGALRWHLAGHGKADGAGRAAGRFLAVGPGEGAAASIWAGSASGVVTAIDPVAGRVRWRTSVGSDETTVFAPVGSGGLLAAAFTDFGVSPRTGGVVALSADTGAIRWVRRFQARSPALPASAGGPLLRVNGLILAAATDGIVYAMDEGDGHIVWRLPPVVDADGDFPHEDFRAVAMTTARLAVTSLTGLVAGYEVGAAGPVDRWRIASPSDGSVAFAVVAHRGRFYVPFASGRVIAFAASDGRPVQAVGGPARRFEWPPAVDVDGRRLLLTSEEGLYECDIAP